MKNETKKLFGAAKISHDKKVAAEKKHKAVIASMASRAKRIANMSEEELKAWKAKNCEASKRSKAKKRAAEKIAAEAAKIQSVINNTEVAAIQQQLYFPK